MSEPLTYDDVVTALAEQQELIAVARQMIHDLYYESSIEPASHGSSAFAAYTLLGRAQEQGAFASEAIGDLVRHGEPPVTETKLPEKLQGFR